MRLYGGGMSPDDQEPDALERRRAATQAEAGRHAHAQAVRTGRWAEAAPGMAVDHHPHDAPPTEQLPPPSPADIEADPTGRRRYLGDTSPHVITTVTCTAPGCTFTGIYYGREDTLQQTRDAGGPRCADHPLEPDADDDHRQAVNELDHQADEHNADPLDDHAGTPTGDHPHWPEQAPATPPPGAPPGRGEGDSVTPVTGAAWAPGQ